jgi:DNA-binding NarL/FixJ family response regulator
MEVVAEAVDGIDLLDKAEVTCPDLVLLDWELPGMTQAQILTELRYRCPQSQVVVLSGRPEACSEALAIGADRFVSKAHPPERLLEAIEAMACQEQPAQAGEETITEVQSGTGHRH